MEGAQPMSNIMPSLFRLPCPYWDLLGQDMPQINALKPPMSGYSMKNSLKEDGPQVAMKMTTSLQQGIDDYPTRNSDAEPIPPLLLTLWHYTQPDAPVSLPAEV
jgi:hypothetical protein